MDVLRYCEHGGRVVGDFIEVPDEPTRYDHSAAPEVGCSRLVCRNCGAPVRNHPGVGGIRPLYTRIGKLYAAEDWSTLPWLESIAARLYACRCQVWLEGASHLMSDPDAEPEDPVLPWRCIGHPPPELPAEVHGARIEPEMDFDPLVRQAFANEAPEPARAHHSFRTFPASWVTALWLQLAGLPAADSLADSVARCLQSDERWLRGSALYFFRRLPSAGGFADVLELAEQPGLLTREWPARYGNGEVLASPLQVLMGRLDAVQPGVVLDATEELAATMLRDRVLSDEAGGHEGLLRVVADYFGDWLASHIEEIEAAWPGRWEPVLDALVVAGRQENAAIGGVAIASGDRVPTRELEAWLERPRNRYNAHGPVIEATLRGRKQ